MIREHWSESFRIPSQTMAPTLAEGDLVFVAKGRTPVVGDVVIVTAGPERLPYAKRVIAVGPARVQVEEGRVVRDGKPLGLVALDGACPLEPPCRFMQEESGGTKYPVVFRDDVADAEKTGETIVPPGEIYVLGDNRNESYDSRHHGPVAPNDVVGVVTMTWWSSSW